MKAAQGNPADNKDYRCNPSILIRYRGGDFIGEKNILVDCGKTFRESVIRWFPRHKVSSVDAVLLSHGHADAIFGLDDIRGLQDRRVIAPMPIYLSPECMQVIRRVLFYLVPDPAKVAPGASRAVSALSWLEVLPNEPLDVLGLEVTPFNVMHGEDMTSFGFLFGGKERVCYISDISRMLPESLELIKQRPIDLLVVDALLKEGKYFSHYNLTEAIALIREVRPRRALLTGMSSQFDHEATNAELRKYLKEEGLDIQLSHDGLSIDIDL
jgi:phosphoribosyl 1,2-cyclic phosphodiesterase